MLHNAAVVSRLLLKRVALTRALASAITFASAGLSLALPAASASAASGPPTLALDGPKRPGLTDKIVASGQVPGFAGEQVTLEVTASGRKVVSKKISPKANGSFAEPFFINACCAYSVTASVGNSTSAPQTFNVGVPKHLSKGPIAKLFNRSLQAQGFHTGTRGPRVTSGTHLAIKAFRKVNAMRWSEAYAPSIFRTLLQGKGAFKPRFDDGKHVEVDISKQVMALVEGNRPVHTFHVSTGTGGTPTVLGNYRFYLKQPGYNSKRMYYSVYFIGGYATHGYSSVPNGRASHGCVRNPIQFSRFIYNWIDLGDPMHTYL
jgi:lipoprotein-anchoring transpeptidase ErfK/SrfK